MTAETQLKELKHCSSTRINISTVWWHLKTCSSTTKI